MSLISDNIKDFRSYAGLKQSDIALKMHTSLSMYKRYESGQTDIPISKLSFLAQEYNLNLNWLITGEGKMILDNNDDELLKLKTELKKIDERLEEMDADRRRRTNPGLDPG